MYGLFGANSSPGRFVLALEAKPGKSALGTRLCSGISAAGPLCPKKIYNFAGVCQWGIASGIAFTIDLICYLNFFYLYFNYKKAMTIT